MTGTVSEVLPAYLPFATFRAAIQNLRAHGLPPQLDKSAWGSRSGTEQGQIWAAFRFFGLVDKNGNTQDVLKKLVDSQEDTASEKSQVADLLKTTYSKVFAIDLTTATPKQLDDAIGDLGVSGVTRKRAVRFFMKAAQHGAIPLSTRLTANLRDRAGAATESGADVEGTDSSDSGAAPKANGKSRKRRRQFSPPPPPLVTPQSETSANAMKTIKLQAVNGTLTINGTFNPFLLAGAERELVYKIIDLMAAYEKESPGPKD